jgi:hypothetical protein
MKYYLILFLALLTFFLQATEINVNKFCKDNIKAIFSPKSQVHLGERLHERSNHFARYPSLRRYINKAEIYELGSGHGSGGHVFRVIEPNGKEYILKYYAYPYVLRNDLYLMNVLSDLDLKHVQLPAVQRNYPMMSLKIESLRGKNIEALLNEIKNPEYKENILGLYHQGLLEILERLLKATDVRPFVGEVALSNPSYLSYLKKEGVTILKKEVGDASAHIVIDMPYTSSEEIFYFRLKPDNFILTDEGELALIDPY